MGIKQMQVAAAALQYSKRMSKFICWVWALYRFATLVLAALVPESAAEAVTSLGALDTIMLVNEGTYLINSLGEKYIYSDRFVLTAFNKGWFKSLFKGVKALSVNEDEEPTQEQYDEEFEEDNIEDEIRESDNIEDEPYNGGEEDGNDNCG